MKKPFPDQREQLRNYLFLFSFIIVLVISSCKKDTIIDKQNPSGKVADLLNDYQPVNPEDVTAWLRSNLTAEQRAPLQVLKAQQSMINQHHVIRIPIGNNAALFFTKTGGKLQVYAYKWLSKDARNKSYTGYVTAYSFQSRSAKQFVYANARKVKENSLQVTTKYTSLANALPSYTPPAAAQSQTTTQPQSSAAASSGDIFGMLWCWLTGGEYISQDDLDNGSSAGANGELGKIGCDYTKAVTTIDDGDFTGGGIYTWGGGGTTIFTPGSPASTGGAGPAPTTGGSTGYGDGSYWVSVYVPSSGCCTNPNKPCTTLCVDAHWETYTMQDPAAIEDLISRLHTSTLTATELANFKNTINTIALSPTGNKILTALDTYYKNNPNAVTLTVTHNFPSNGGTDDFDPNTHTINMGSTYATGNFLSYMVYTTAHEIYHEFETIKGQSPLYSNFEADGYMFGARVTKEAPQDGASDAYENSIAALPKAPNIPDHYQTDFNSAWTDFTNGTTTANNYAKIINNFLKGSTIGFRYTTYAITTNGVKTIYTVTNNPGVLPLFF